MNHLHLLMVLLSSDLLWVLLFCMLLSPEWTSTILLLCILMKLFIWIWTTKLIRITLKLLLILMMLRLLRFLTSHLLRRLASDLLLLMLASSDLLLWMFNDALLRALLRDSWYWRCVFVSWLNFLCRHLLAWICLIITLRWSQNPDLGFPTSYW